MFASMARVNVGPLLLLVGCVAAPPEPPPSPGPSEAALRDFDGDGFPDPRDGCPRVAGVAPLGCPADADRDGVPDASDACPKDQGSGTDGCNDGDRDGVPEPRDACAGQAETRNGYLDADGCPDVFPDDLARIVGTIKGVQFELDRETLKPASAPALLRVVKVLEKYPDVRVEISGHVDSTAVNGAGLSAERARAVKEFFVAQGIDAGRLQTRGAGPDEPLDTNKTAAGRKRNRRVELTIVAE
jgi:outer membrane protein OmpA-like peptidoglycan-associated protein